MEGFVREHDGEFTEPEIWENLSQKMDRKTFDHIIGLLQYVGKISADETGKIAWIPYPVMMNRRTTREEANAITCYAFRNGFIEELHAGGRLEQSENPERPITDAEMKKLMIEASEKMAKLLKMKHEDPGEYWRLIDYYTEAYCKNWEK